MARLATGKKQVSSSTGSTGFDLDQMGEAKKGTAIRGKRYCRTNSKGIATVSVKKKVQYSEQDGPAAHRSRAIFRSEQSRKSVYCTLGVVYIIAQGLEAL